MQVIQELQQKGVSTRQYTIETSHGSLAVEESGQGKIPAYDAARSAGRRAGGACGIVIAQNYGTIGNTDGRFVFMTNGGGLDEYFSEISPLRLPKEIKRLNDISRFYRYEYLQSGSCAAERDALDARS